MTLNELLHDSSIKAKAKAAQIGAGLIEGRFRSEDLVALVATLGGAQKATCIEALEFATKKSPEVADRDVLDFVTRSLDDDEPRVKWESARVIGNVAERFPDHLGPSIDGLLRNAEHDGSVVRWATALALGAILPLLPDHAETLLPEIEALCEREEDSGVQKKYSDAIKKARKRTPPKA